MLRALLAVALLAAPALAGCLTPPEDLEAAAAALDDVILPGTETWWTVPAQAAPGGALTAFWWTVPEGALIEDPEWEVEAVAVEIALFDAAGAAPDLARWALVSFEEDDGALVQRGGVVVAPVSYEYVALGGSYADEFEVSAAPSFVFLGWEKVKEGDRLGLVLAADAAEVVDLTLAFRVLDAFPDWEKDEPASSPATFLAARTSPPQHVLDVASGEGFAVAFLMESFGTLPLYAFSMSTGDIERSGDDALDARPAGVVREETLRTQFPGDEGHAVLFGFHASGAGDTAWSATGTARRETLDASGRQVGPAWMIGSPAFFYVVSDGAGARDVTLSLSGTSTGWDSLFLFALDLGATLESLLGIAGVSEAHAPGPGILDLPVLAERGGDLVVRTDGGALRLVGASMPR